MYKAKILILLVFIMLFLSTNILVAQEVSEKRDIAIFKLSYYDWTIPNEALGSIDSEIRQVFVNLGRFNVLAMTYRLGAKNVMEFINKIKEFKEQSVEIPEEVAMGHAIFTEADLNQLVSSFIVIIPAVTYFNVKVQKNEKNEFQGYQVEMKTSFSILNVDTMVLVSEIILETSGYNEDRETAIQDAINSITNDLAFEIKSIPIFTLKTGVLEVYPRGLTLQMGKDMGIRMGYEFVVLEEQVLSSGHKRTRETALVIVNTVDEEISEATILYGQPQEGDQLKEIPRLGVESQIYAHPLIDPLSMDMPIVAAGIRATAALGFYSWRPMAGLEMHINSSMDPEQTATAQNIWGRGIPFTPYLGIEYAMYLGRLQLAPAAALGLSGVYFYEETLEGDKGAITHVGGKAYLAASYLVTRDLKIALDLGAAFWLSISQEEYVNFYGILAGISVTWKG